MLMANAGYRLSTVNPENGYRLSSVENFFEIDRRREEAGVTIEALCRAAGVNRKTWSDIRSRPDCAARPETLRRLADALSDLAVAKSPDLLQGRLRTLLALLAADTGDDAKVVLATDFSRQRPQDKGWLAAARLRRFAIYLIVVEEDVRMADMARAIGISRQAVKQTVDEVREWRLDEPDVDALLERVGEIIRPNRR